MVGDCVSHHTYINNSQRLILLRGGGIDYGKSYGS